MPPRYSYWTILAEGLPTSFRAADRDDLLPTLRRLQERHPDAEMKWFQRGKLWSSPEDAQKAFQKVPAPRGRDWRPGGDHRDPREPFQKKKRERNQARRKERFARTHRGADGQSGDRSTPAVGKPEASPRSRVRHPVSRQTSNRRPRR